MLKAANGIIFWLRFHGISSPLRIGKFLEIALQEITDTKTHILFFFIRNINRSHICKFLAPFFFQYRELSSVTTSINILLFLNKTLLILIILTGLIKTYVSQIMNYSTRVKINRGKGIIFSREKIKIFIDNTIKSTNKILLLIQLIILIKFV